MKEKLFNGWDMFWFGLLNGLTALAVHDILFK